VIGKLPVAAIDKTLTLKIVEPIWQSKNETASRVRGRIASVLDYARVQGWRDGDNPAAWDGNLEHALPAPGTFTEVKHHAALPYAEIHDFMAQLATREGMGARALEFLILTATRTRELIGARWDEIPPSAKLWTIPAERMKAKKEHRVPLSERAVAILKALPCEGDYLFPGDRKGVPISNAAMAAVIDRMNADNTRHGRPRYTDPKEQNRDVVPHGFRSTFRDWAGETTAYPNHVVEMALAHAIGSKVEAAYRRKDLFAKRVHLMAAWAKYCATKPIETTGNVLPMTAKGARR
jgi:integrase